MKNTVKILSDIISLIIFSMFSCSFNELSADCVLEITKLPETQFIANNRYYITDILVEMEVKINNSDGTGRTYTYANDLEFFENELKFTGDCIDENKEKIITITLRNIKADFTVTGVKVEGIGVTKNPERTGFIVNNEYF